MDPVLLLIGVVLVGVAVGLALRLWWRARTWVLTDSVVIRINDKRGEAKLRFLDPDRRQRTTVVSTLGRRLAVDDVVPLRYNPDNPPRTLVVGPVRLTLIALGLGLVSGLGALLVVLALRSTPDYAALDTDLGIPWPVAIGCGLLAAAAALTAMAHEGRRQWTWRHTHGTVTATRTTESDTPAGHATDTHHWTTYRFVDGGGQERTATTDTHRRRLKSERVRVRHDPDDPARSEIVSVASRAVWWAVCVVLLLVGVGLLIAGYAAVVRA